MMTMHPTEKTVFAKIVVFTFSAMITFAFDGLFCCALITKILLLEEVFLLLMTS